jgi:hypothetical protein
MKYRRNSQWHRDFDDYYILDSNRNMLVQTHVDLDEKARELGILREWETVVEGCVQHVP